VAALDRQVQLLSENLADVMLAEGEGEQADRQRLRHQGSSLLRIIGGRPTATGAFPECCLIGNSSGGGFLNDWFCTGTLIHPRVVITAKHCIAASSGVPDPNSIAIGVSAQRDVKQQHIVRVLKIYTHPREDVAVLVLQKAAPVEPIACASAAELEGADGVHLVGFGNDNPSGTMGFGIKREVGVNMNVIRRNPGEDLREAEGLLGFNSRTEFVAGRKGSGKDSCNGDSGGPAYVGADEGRKLAGVTSRATDEADDNCGDGGVYVRIDTLKEWIDGIAGSLT
jgi:endonuclease G